MRFAVKVSYWQQANFLETPSSIGGRGAEEVGTNTFVTCSPDTDLDVQPSFMES